MSLALLQHSAADAHASRKFGTAQLVFLLTEGQSDFGAVTAGAQPAQVGRHGHVG